MRGIMWTNLGGGGDKWSLKKEEGGALGVYSRKPFDSFHRVSFGLCFCQSMSLL